MASPAARLAPIAVPVVLIGALAFFVPIAQQQSATLCTVPAGTGAADARLDSAQVSNARTVVAVGAQLALPARAWVVAIATTMTESALRNLPGGDRDSAGLFQQRPSQGWGTYAEVTDPVHAARAFYDHLTVVPDWQQLPVTVAAQAVQRSATPSAYAHWESFATALVSRITSGLLTDTCATVEQAASTDTGGSAGTDLPVEQMGPDGLTDRTRHVLVDVAASFGVHEIGGFCPGGCTTGHGPVSDHYTGHAIDVMLLPLDQANRDLGDRIASWLVANATRLAISYVIWHDHIWSLRRAAEGWRTYTSPWGGTSVTLRHLDHVHISVS